MGKRILYCIVDCETTKKNGLVFDMAYRVIDKKRTLYAVGSFLFKDVLAIEEAWYKEKVSQYWLLVNKGKIKPVTFKVGRRIFNRQIAALQAKGYKIIFCAYNAAFDISHLGMTSEELTKQKFLDVKMPLFDLWHGWVAGCPVEYGYFAPFTVPAPGKKPAWNIKTSAEVVYKWLSDDAKFEEKHIAHSDVLIEEIILMDILKRKKKMHIVKSPKDFVAMPWKIAQERCKGPIEYRKAKQMSFEATVNKVPDISTRQGHMTDKPTIVFPKPLGEQVAENQEQIDLLLKEINKDPNYEKSR